jgi:TRAP-type mannitol/chloroaromatic compound transport system substrate-binding protein
VYESMNAYMKPGYSWFQVAELNYDSFMIRHNNA